MMTKIITIKDFNEIYCKNKSDNEQLLIVNLIERFGIHQRQQVNQSISPKSNDEKLWFESNILKYSQYPSFVRYQWQIENGNYMVVYACGGKIINMFPNGPILESKL